MVFPIEMIITANPEAEKVRYGPFVTSQMRFSPAFLWHTFKVFNEMPDFFLSAESREVNSDDTRHTLALIIAQYYPITTPH